MVHNKYSLNGFQRSRCVKTSFFFFLSLPNVTVKTRKRTSYVMGNLLPVELWKELLLAQMFFVRPAKYTKKNPIRQFITILLFFLPLPLYSPSKLLIASNSVCWHTCWPFSEHNSQCLELSSFQPLYFMFFHLIILPFYQVLVTGKALVFVTSLAALPDCVNRGFHCILNDLLGMIS